MGYDVHITRASEWYESGTAPITIEEWIGLIENDPEMRLDGFAEATTANGETIRTESGGLAVWTKYSGHGRNGSMAWFDYFRGRIDVKNPDEEIIQKMCRIAVKLKARVVGDEDEVYGGSGEA